MQKRLSYHILIGFLCLCSWASNLNAQYETNVQIKHLDYKDGLIGRRATAICQDSDGFMWIATIDALNRYDGYTFKHFNQSNSDLNYRELRVRDFYEDEEGYLWLIYYDGIEFIHHETFEVLTFEERFGNTDFQPDKIRYSAQNENGQILIELNNLKKYLYYNKTLKYLPFMGVHGFYLSNAGVWDCNPNQAILYNFEGKKLKSLKSKYSHLQVFHQSQNGKVYGSIYDNASKQFRIFSFYDGKEKEIAAIPIKKEFIWRWRFKLDEQNNYIIAYNSLDFDLDIFYIDLESRKYKRFPIEGDKTFLHKDRNSIIWITSNQGLSLIKLQKTPFEYYKDVVNTRGIWANQEKVIVSSSHLKDYIYNINDQSSGTILDHDFYAISKIHDQLWGGNNGQFIHLDINENKLVQSIPFKQKFNGSIWSCLKDSNENWWFGHQRNVTDQHILYYNSFQRDSVDAFSQYNDFQELKGALVIHFLEDEDVVWAASNKGLICIDKQKGVIGVYHKNAQKDFQLPFQDVYWLYKDKQGTYWAATNYDGLVKFSLDDKRKVASFKKYSTDNDLSSNVVYSIFEDDFQRLWLSTLNGISCFNKRTENVQIFTDQTGILPIYEFNRTSGFQAKDGRIYFGGVNGAVGFYPSAFDTLPYNQPLLLSSIQFFEGANEELVDQTSNILSLQKIIIEPSVRYAKLEVALADYFYAKDATYFYKIEGLHDNFRLADGNTIQLNNLSYGNYNLRIKGKSANKQFSVHEIHLPLIVVRPFYLRWWFITLCLLGIGLLLWLLHNLRIAQLKKRQLELESIVAQRTEKIRADKILIEQQAEELKALDKIKDQFFTNISHELRTPLTLILGPLSSLLGDSSNFSNKHFTYLNVIKRHTNYLMKRINEIMELNRLEAKKGQINLQPIRLYNFIKLILGSFESIAPQKNIQFSFEYQMEKNIQILIDKDKFEHIIYNFLSNAFKYTPKDGKVKVIVEEVDHQLRLVVKDTGIGIREEDIPNLFERFFQAKNADMASSSGVGLALCKEIAELLGGKVWATSKLGKGSSFFFEVPYSEAIGMIEEEITGVNEKQSQIALNHLIQDKPDKKNNSTILVTEDNPELRDYIQMILSENYQVYTTSNGKEALDWLSKNPEPSLIISDIMMPIMDGFELLKHIKNTDQYRHIPMVMLTARHNIETKLSALQLGVDDYITKPFNEQELIIRIQNLLKNQKEKRSFVQEDNQKNNANTIVLTLSKSDQKWLDDLENLVNENLNNNQFTVASCAEHFHISERQLQRRIKKLTGLNLNKYIRLAKLNQARELLKKGEIATVSEVAYQVGFETTAYFSKLFYQEYGKRPTEYL